MQNINEVIGIIKGISYDGVINNKEIEFLENWVNKNRHFAVNLSQKKLIKLIDEALYDKVLTDLERRTILNTAQTILDFQNDKFAIYTELNGIIEGVISDNEINNAEILNLQEWFSIHNQTISDEADNIKDTINKILEDGVITNEEQETLLSILKKKIDTLRVDSKLKYLRNTIRESKNIGIDLIDLLDKNNNMSAIHSEAEKVLCIGLIAYGGLYVDDPEIVVVSLTLIAMLNYDGSFYDSVRKVYKDLYSVFSNHKVEGLIRNVLSRYRLKEELSTRARIINYPLRQAIVPKHFLPNFFEFIFDIYKLNFEYDLSEDLYEDFEFVYDGLKTNMGTDGDDLVINVTQKTYKLIQTTKDLVVKEGNFDPLIKLSIMIIQLIDQYMWNKEVDVKNQYLKYGFEKWIEVYTGNENVRGVKRTNFSRTQWKPKICLQNNDVYLIPPIHRIKSQYNSYDLKVVVKNDGEIIYKNDSPDVREIIGGYQMKLDKIKISRPLGHLTYLLLAGNEVIYTSENQLYRDFIVFNQNGQEILNNTDYHGFAIICSKSNNKNCEEYYRNNYYLLSSVRVKNGDTLILDNQLFNFTTLTKPGVFGDKYDNCNLVCLENNKEYDVYKSLKCLVFEDDKEHSDYIITVNYKRHLLEEFKYSKIEREGSNKFVVELDLNKPGIYSLSIYRNDNHNYNIGSFEFVYDPELVINSIKVNDKKYLVSVCSSLFVEKMDENINLDNFDVDDIQFEYLRKKYVYRLPLNFNIYRLEGENWKNFSDDLWIGDIKADSILQIYGCDAGGINVYASTGALLETINVNKSGPYSQVEIGFLNSYKEYEYVSLVFLKDNKAINATRCYNRCYIDENGVDTRYDSVKNELSLTTQYKGKGLIIYEIYNKDNILVYKSSPMNNGETYTVSDLNSFEYYKINIVEKTSGLFLGPKKVLKTVFKKVYAKKDFVGRNFKIDEVYYCENVGRKLVERVRGFYKNYIKFTEQIDESTFKGYIYAKNSNGIYWLNKVNPVEIEVNSDVISGKMDLYITNEGDGLLIDLKHNNIMNSLDDFNAPCIESYTVDANGKKEL